MPGGPPRSTGVTGPGPYRWAHLCKIARIRATSTKADAARDANDAAIVEAQEKEEERQRQQGCRKQLLSSLQRVGSTGSNSEGEEMFDEDDE